MANNKSILNEKSIDFLAKYLNNAAPTGYEWEGQKIWMDYLKPYVDDVYYRHLWFGCRGY